MDEQRKMLAGLPYNSLDKTLVAQRKRAKQLCHRYNHLPPEQQKTKNKLLAELLNLDGIAFIEPQFWVDYGYNIYLGKRFYANHNLTILDCCEVRFGDNVLIGPNVLISTATHPTDPVERRTTEYAKPISIGNDVWIGGNVVILPGVTIGDGVTIGAGSVVTKSIPNKCVAVGNPCKVKSLL